jgi:hypothetical protein
MSSDLEKFIQRNRGDFDEDQPSEKVWEKIKANFPTEKKTTSFSLNRFLKWTAAAAILFAIFTSAYFLFIKKYSHENKNREILTSTQPEETGSITPEYAAEFNRVYQSVTTRQKELERAATFHSELYKQFQEDLSVLDSSYRLLKSQVMQSVNQDLLTRAMIQNLQLQAELLNRQLQIINQFKNTKKISHETSI